MQQPKCNPDWFDCDQVFKTRRLFFMVDDLLVIFFYELICISVLGTTVNIAKISANHAVQTC